MNTRKLKPNYKLSVGLAYHRCITLPRQELARIGLPSKGRLSIQVGYAPSTRAGDRTRTIGLQVRKTNHYTTEALHDVSPELNTSRQVADEKASLHTKIQARRQVSVRKQCQRRGVVFVPPRVSVYDYTKHRNVGTSAFGLQLSNGGETKTILLRAE